MLATVSSGVGVAVALVAGGETLEHVHFSRLAKVAGAGGGGDSNGLVRDRMLALDMDRDDKGVGGRRRNFLNEHFRGWSVERVRAEIGRLVEREKQ